MEEKLEKIHAQINELMKLGEAKNAGLLLINGLLCLEMLKQIFDPKATIYHLMIFSYVLILNAMSFFLCLYALFPNKQQTLSEAHEEPRNNENLLFFGVISRFGIDSYYEEFKSRYSLTPKSEQYCKDLIEQIIIQSQILTRKFNKFGLSAILTISSFVSPVAFLLLLRSKGNSKKLSAPD